MSALVRKEIRLLLPAWITAMLLVIAPIPLGQVLDDNAPASVTFPLTVYCVAIGCVILGLAGFGREMSSRTFSLFLAQPRPREEYWRAKVGVLLASLVPLALFLGLVSWRFVPYSARLETAQVWFITACVAVTGGLWTTLLFRQIIASFWISVLAPFAILVSVLSLDDEIAEGGTRNTLATVLLLTYSVAGYLFARWQFRHAQDTAWTGGNVSLPSAARWLPRKRTETVRQKTHPLRALLGKEFQFQQVSLMLAGLLLVVQVAVLLLHKFVNTSERSVLDMIVHNFWGIWIIMPLLVGCSAVAEERKLGTLEPVLCLPVSRAWQFAVKVFVTLICGTVLGALVPVALAFINPTRGTTGLEFAVPWTLACVGLALVSVYASSLTHQLLQALGAAVGIIVVGLFLGGWFGGGFSRGENFSLFGVYLWRGPLVFIVGASVMLLFALALTWRRLRWVWLSFLALMALALLGGRIQWLLTVSVARDSQVFGFKTIAVVAVALALCPVALTVALAARNFNHTQTSLSLWLRNSATWLGCLLLTGVINTLVYNRVWELAMPFEPPAGPPRLSGSVRPVILGTFMDQHTVVLLPDGRLCSFRGYEQTNSSQTAESEPVWRPIKNPRVEFIGGSNWVAIATTGRDFAGVKSDGSLWSAPWLEQVDHAGNVFPLRTGSPPQKGLKLRPTGLKFERFGNESGWVMVAASWLHCVALKRDGTIWGWGDNGNKQLGDGPSSITNGPVQIGQDSNWVAVYAGQGHSYSVNRAGEIWKWGKFTAYNGDPYHRKTEDGPVRLNIKVPGVRSITAGPNDFALILDTDGNLWGVGQIPPALGGGGFGNQYYSEPKRIGGTNWLSVSCSWQGLAGLKTDGTLWNQRSRDLYNEPLPTLTQLGKRNDWIAVMSDWEADVALGRDGTICRFGEPSLTRIRLLAPTRRVTWSLNLVEAAK